MASTNPHGLTDKQLKFCNEYLLGFNATRAAIAAGYSENSAHDIGSENLRKPEIQNYLKVKQDKLAIKHDITLDKVVKEYSKIAFHDIRKCFDESGDLIPIHELDEDTAGAIAGMEVYEEKGAAGDETFTSAKTKKIKILDKRAALDSLCKVLGYNEAEKHELTGKDGDAIKNEHRFIIQDMSDGSETKL